jgi:beta-lactam-binding protein with PASTA domain
MQTNESKWPKKLLIGLLIGFLCFVFIVTAAPLLGLWISVRQEQARRTPQVKVPSVVGQDYRTAEAVLKEKGLMMRVLAKRSDQNQPIDIILDQVPRGGENVDVGYTIGVTIGDFRADGSVSPHR